MLLTRSLPKVGNAIKRILVRCPQTGKLTDTGRTVEEASFPTTRLTNNKLTCLHCGQVHSWTKKDVVLAR